MMREVAILGTAVAVFHLACPPAHATPSRDTKVHRVHRNGIASIRPETPHIKRHAAPLPAETSPAETSYERVRPSLRYMLPPPAIDTSAGMPISLSFHVPSTNGTPPTLSEQEREVSQMADEKGDKTFIMVDKTLGKIILFQNGQPVFTGPALTGASLADRLPKSELTEKFDDLNALDTKITPAGRYTLERGYDKEVGGDLFEVQEIRGKDWGIAIHPVYLGIPSEHRDIRIMSPNEQDKHITFGCINVTPDAINFLLRELPEKGATPLYILPVDASQTATYFAARTS